MQSLLPESSRCASPQGRFRFRTPRSAGGTGGVVLRPGVLDLDPPGVRRPDALNPPEESPSEPSCLLRSMPEPWRLSGREALKLLLEPSALRARDGPRRVSWLTCHEVQRECDTPPRSLHGALLSSQRHRARRSDVACLGAASARRAIPDHHHHTARRNRGGGDRPPRSPRTRPRSVDRNVSDFSSIGGEQLENKVFDQLPLLLAVPRAAAILGISRASAYRLVATGELPSRRLGGRVYVVTAALRELVAA